MVVARVFLRSMCSHIAWRPINLRASWRNNRRQLYFPNFLSLISRRRQQSLPTLALPQAPRWVRVRAAAATKKTWEKRSSCASYYSDAAQLWQTVGSNVWYVFASVTQWMGQALVETFFQTLGNWKQRFGFLTRLRTWKSKYFTSILRGFGRCSKHGKCYSRRLTWK